MGRTILNLLIVIGIVVSLYRVQARRIGVLIVATMGARHLAARRIRRSRHSRPGLISPARRGSGACASPLLIAAACILATIAQAAPQVLDVHVVEVADGDSLTVRDSNGVTHGVRLAGIDAPEHGQPYSRQSKSNLIRMALDEDARIEWFERDGYGRFVAKLWVVPADAPCQASSCPRTLDTGLAQVTAGLAWHYKKYERDQREEDRHRYADAETEARARRLGLWQDPAVAPPWDWRHGLANGPIKKSRRDVCHAPASPTYPTVTRFTSHPTVEACLASGGRLPKPSGG